MADWYASSAAYAAVPAFAISTAYTVGQFVKPITPALKAQWVMRCTTAGTSAGSEPTWPTANNGTVTSGGAVFTNVTGQSTYGWSAAAGDVQTLIGAVGAFRFIAGDRMFVSSDHTETQTSSSTYGSGNAATSSFSVGQILSVNRAGSVPPVAADLTPGATVTVSGGAFSLTIDCYFPLYHYGMNYVFTGTSASTSAFRLANNGYKTHYFDACQLYLNTTTASIGFVVNGPVTTIFNNSSVRFGAVTQSFQGQIDASHMYPWEIIWLNTATPIAGAIIPTNLFEGQNYAPFSVTMRGVDLSAVTTTLVRNALSTASGALKFLFDSCRIASGVTRYSYTNQFGTREEIEFVNCYNGSNFLSERYRPAGIVTTEFTITLGGGAQDNVGIYSHKMVSNTTIDKFVNTLDGFWIDVGNFTIGGSRTATVEIISSASLNNDEISLLLEYEGTSGSSLASFVNSLPATILTSASAVTSSSATWNSSPATPVTQKLQVTFTPQVVGRVRGQVRLGKASTTVYVDPRIVLT